MRSLNVPWLSSRNPNLETQGQSTQPQAERMSDEELQELLKPRHMSESYTSFDLPLKSDPELLERYVNPMGGFRELFKL